MSGANVPAGEAIRDEAARWVERMERPAIDAADAQAFDRWMDADARHREAFARALTTWHSPQLREALAAAAEVPAQDEEAPHTRWRWAVAGGRLLATCLLAMLLLPMLLTQEYRTGPGSGERILLADGSEVRLSGNATLAVTMLPWERATTLARGEAFFDVRHERRPFTGDAGAAEIRVLGTAFNIDRRSSPRADVAVYRGAVQVDVMGKAGVLLHRGDAVLAADGKIARRQADLPTRPEWIDGWFVPQDVPASALVAKLNRHLYRPVAISDAAMSKRRITGRFHVADPDAVLQALPTLNGISFQKSEH
jgi:transmembrane sensor